MKELLKKIALTILGIIIIFMVYYFFHINKSNTNNCNEIISNTINKNNTNVYNEIISNTINENKKLVLRSNYEENKEKKNVFKFDDDILTEIDVYEKYYNKEDYEKKKKFYENNNDKYEIITVSEEELSLLYKKLDFDSDKDLSYNQIYDKYMGIIGAYEVIEE